MATIKRVNLCFDIERLEDNRVYEILQKQRNKTGYVIKVVLDNIENDRINVSEESLKRIIKEAFGELDIVVDRTTEKKNNENDDIPEDVFDIISNI